MNKKNDFDKAFLEMLRKELRDGLERLHDIPDGEEKALKEADVVFRTITKLDPETVAKGKLSNAYALFAISRDYTVNDFEVGGRGNNSQLSPEVFSITAGAYADALREVYDVYKENRKAACKTVSKWLPKDRKMTWRTVENWTRDQREWKATGRQGGYEILLRDAVKILKRAGTQNDGEILLKERLQTFARNTSLVAKARKAFKTKR